MWLYVCMQRHAMRACASCYCIIVYNKGLFAYSVSLRLSVLLCLSFSLCACLCAHLWCGCVCDVPAVRHLQLSVVSVSRLLSAVVFVWSCQPDDGSPSSVVCLRCVSFVSPLARLRLATSPHPRVKRKLGCCMTALACIAVSKIEIKD